MKAGAEKGLEQLAELTGTFEKAAVRAAYGKTIDAKSVQKLVDAVVSYQENAVRKIAEQRKLATERSQSHNSSSRRIHSMTRRRRAT